MSKLGLALLIAVVAAGNVATIAILLGVRSAAPAGDIEGAARADAALAPIVEPLVQAIDALRQDVQRLSADAAARGGAAALDDRPGAAAPADAALAARLDQVVERLAGLETTLAAMKDVNDELTMAKLHEKRQEQFRAEDGFAVADELLAQKKLAVGANGILTFLDAHPEHPDARDLMKKARDAFFEAGYREKALWLHGEIMRKFPEQRSEDAYMLAMLEKQMRKYDDALRHIGESIDLSRTAQERLNRMFYRAYLIHERDGDAAGLEAYREVERAGRAAGVQFPSNEAAKRAGEIEERLASR